MYCFRDRVSGLYSSPFSGPEKAEVLARSIRSAVSAGAQEPWAQYPLDHELYKIGTYDNTSGQLEACTPSFVFNLSDVLEV